MKHTGEDREKASDDTANLLLSKTHCPGIAVKVEDEGPPLKKATLLAFAFDEAGNAKVRASFASSRDKFALLGLARVVIDQFTAEATRELVQPLLPRPEGL